MRVDLRCRCGTLEPAACDALGELAISTASKSKRWGNIRACSLDYIYRRCVRVTPTDIDIFASDYSWVIRSHDETARLMAEKGIWLSTQPFLEEEGENGAQQLGPAEQAKMEQVIEGTDNVY